MRRLELNKLGSQEPAERSKDIRRYADIALDLDSPGIAAMLYWNTLTGTRPDAAEASDLIEHFLYCLEALGVKDIKDNFQGDHPAEFARIKAEQAKRMKQAVAKD